MAPNPMVGAVLVYKEKIIGEGHHQKYGQAHAEVNCISSVKEEDKGLITDSTLYVSLEPCSHYGKTPPCTGLIIQNKIPKVVIGSLDPFNEVDARLNPALNPVPIRTGVTRSDKDTIGQGKGIEILKTAGVQVGLASGEMENECKEFNKRFFTFHKKHRPFVILKWAQTADGKIASPPTPLPKWSGEASGDPESPRLFIRNEYSNRLVHKWRSEEAAILIGTNTALLDDPELTTRLWPGPSPIRLVVDLDLKLPSSLKIFNNASPTIIFNTKIHSKESEWTPPSALIKKEGVRYYQVTPDISIILQIINALYQLKIQSVLVEGGARLLQSFIDEGLWDEARIIKSSELRILSGLEAPQLQHAIKIEEQTILSNTVEIFKYFRG